MLPLGHTITSMPAQGQSADEKGWRALANELRVRILEELAPTDLLSCLKVARTFKTLVEGTPSLRNKLIFYAAGMREGPPGGSSISERLAQLEEYENTWKTGDIPVRKRSFRGNCQGGGLFIDLDRHRKLLDITRPASFFSGIPEKTWTVDLSALREQGGPDLGSVGSDGYVVDPSQDLLVLMALPYDDDEYPECHVLSMSGNGTTHPLAARRQIYDGSCLGWTESPRADVEIMGDLIGCTIFGMDICMSVYNWKTGAMLWCDSEGCESEGGGPEFDEPMNTVEYHTRCHILDSTHVLKISKYDLTVYRMAVRGATAGRVACRLGLPALADGFETKYRASYIQRQPEALDCSPHFECDPSLTVLVVEYDVMRESGSQLDGATLIVVTPVSTILAQNQGTRRKLSWEDWGALGARLILIPYQRNSLMPRHIDALGSRVAVSVFLASRWSRTVEVVVFDVRKGAQYARDPESGANREEKSSVLVLDRYTEEDTPIFKGPVEAKMPYRMVKTRRDSSQIEARNVSLLCDGLCA